MKKILFGFVTLCVVLQGCGGPEELTKTEAALYPSPSCVRFTMSDGFMGQSCLANPYSWTEQVYIDGSASLFAHGEIVRVETGVNATAYVCDTYYPLGFAQGPWVACWSGATNYSSTRFRGVWRSDLGAFAPMAADMPLVAGHYGRAAVVSRGYLSTSGMPVCPYQGNFFTFPQGLPGGPGYPYHFYLVEPAVGPGSGDYQFGFGVYREDYNASARISGNYPGGNNGAPCMGYDPQGNWTPVIY